MAAKASLSFLLLLGLILVASYTSHCEAKANGHDGPHHFVLVHGLGHGAWCWYKITTLLQQAGHHVTSVDLTSNGIDKVVADTVTSLPQYLQPLTEFLANTNDTVILVGHSLGGSSISYAMELFSEKIEKAIFLAALMPSNNQTFVPADVLQALGVLFSQGVAIQNFANGPSFPPTSISINLGSAKEYFYTKSPLEDVNLALTLLNPTPFAPLLEVLTLTPAKYGSIPRFYIKTPLDNVIVPALQASFIQQNPPSQEFTIQQSDHSPFFSKHVILANLLLSLA
ncbi:hypothetical protein GOP47_0002687 [Adiantum capillus-veneris]|uniref:AB hydrolase-1 domain-containing protein n=1 Tax=Adiantum capillus-veneris TaxID=13818 RepID=A0A9D4ZPE3_ADICA|nr:hypothetical protein GOP47_0002687 [Adiantum capillus-veneris]